MLPKDIGVGLHEDGEALFAHVRNGHVPVATRIRRVPVHLQHFAEGSLDAQRYLECVLRLAPHGPMQRMLELAPSYWRETAARLTPEQQATVRPSWSAAFDVFAPASEPAATSTAA